MGRLTTFTLYNDGIGQVLIDPEGFCSQLYRHAHGTRAAEFGHGSYANLVKVQRPRHADDHTIYVHMGNTVSEMNADSRDTDLILRRNPEYFADMLALMEQQATDLQAKLEDYRSSPPG